MLPVPMLIRYRAQLSAVHMSKAGLFHDIGKCALQQLQPATPATDQSESQYKAQQLTESQQMSASYVYDPTAGCALTPSEVGLLL